MMKLNNCSQRLVLLLLPFLFSEVSSAVDFSSVPKSIYEIQVKNIGDQSVPLSQYKGKVLLIVNTASHCGFTPQYEALQGLYQKYQKQGLEILGFPSNDFGSQEPGSNKEIKSFCETKYKVAFPLFDKNPVKGSQKQVLYQWLIKHDPAHPQGDDAEVKWNFEKFLISRDGKVLARFRSPVKPDSPEVVKAIEEAMKARH